LSELRSGSKALLERPYLYDDAFITSLSRYGEADCIVRLFTRSSGRLSAFFRRGLMPTRLSGAVAVLTYARIAHSNLSDDRMTKLYQVDLDPSSLGVASSLKLFAYNAYIAELVEKLVPEYEIAEAIFDLILMAHKTLLEKGPQSFILRALELKLLDKLGYLAEIPIKDQDFFYDPLSSCFLVHRTTQAFFISSSALRIGKELLAAPLGAIHYEDHEELMMLGRIFHSRLKLLGLLPLKSLAFFKQVLKSEK
jgi:DNA repair protein RecO